MRLLLPVLLAGCATLPPPPPLTHAATGADVDRLVADFYGTAIAPADAAARADALLRRYPDSSRLHEVAALAAFLRGDSDGERRHFARAAADLDADATELYVRALDVEAPQTDTRASLALLEALRRHHPRANVRALATWVAASLLDRSGRGDEAEARVRQLGFLGDWQILGALDNDQGKGFLTRYPPEDKIDLTATVQGPLVPLRWRRLERLSRLGGVMLQALLWPREFAVAYLVTWVHSDREVRAELRLTTGSPTRVFVDDALALSEERVSYGDFDNLIAPVTLHAGWNQILVKSAQRRGGWIVRARLSDRDGAPLAGITTSSDPRPFLTSTAAPNSDTLRAEPALTGPENRRRLLDARLHMLAGRSRAALSSLQDLLDAAPANLIAELLGALAYSDNEELGKAIDLLNQGVTATGGRAAAFLIDRGRYYMQKQLWEKAQADLTAAVALDPNARPANEELAQLYHHRGWQIDRCRVLEGMLARRRDDARALRQHASCTAALGYLDAADRELVRAAALERDPAERDRLELAWRRNDFALVKKLLASIRARDPIAPGLVVEEAELARRTGQPESARLRLVEAARIAPEWPAPRHRLGELAYEAGRRDEALAAWKAAHDRDPNNSALAQQIEFLEPTRLGFIERFVPGDAEIDRALAQAVKPHPGSQMILLFDHEVTEVNADGSTRSVATQIEKAIDEHGRDTMTHVRLPSQGTLKILRAYALTPAGERQEASSIRGGEVRFRNLQIGSRTIVQYVHYAPVGGFLPGAYAADWYFQSPGRQHEESTWVLVLPKGKTLHVHKTGAISERVVDEGDRRVHIFSARHLPPLVREEHMPPAGDLLAQVDVSTVESWDDYVRWERALLLDAFRSNSRLDALTDKLIAGVTSPREKFDRLFHHVAQEVRYQQDYETTIAGVRPHAAAVVDERRYGDCKDKAVLLIEMAKRAGVHVDFAILRTTGFGRVKRDVPNQQFNHAIVYVPKQPGIDQPFFMDPTVDGLDIGNLRVDDQGATALVMDPDSGKYEFRDIPYQPAELTFDHHQIRIEVRSPTEASASDQMSLRGQLAANVRQLLRNEGVAKKLFEAVAAQLFPGTTLKEGKAGDNADVWHPLSVTLALDVSESIRAQESHWRLQVPGNFHLEKAMTLKQRETPLYMGPYESSTSDVVASLPEGYEVVHAPSDFTVEHACFSMTRKTEVQKRRVEVHDVFSRRCAEIAVADYGAFRSAVQRAVHDFDAEIVFGKAKKPVGR